jgi:hypothetical protein
MEPILSFKLPIPLPRKPELYLILKSIATNILIFNNFVSNHSEIFI